MTALIVGGVAFVASGALGFMGAMLLTIAKRADEVAEEQAERFTR